MSLFALNPKRDWEESVNRVQKVRETFSKLGVYVSAPTLLCFSDNINSPAMVWKTI